MRIHRGDEFIDNKLSVYRGGSNYDLKFDVDKWSFFKLVVVLKELGTSHFLDE